MISLARRLARQSNHPLFRHAAIVQRGGAVVSTGYNRDGVHAEAMAIHKLWPSERIGTRVWSIRVTKSGKITNAKPCPACQETLRTAGVKVVFYSDAEGQIQRMKL